MKEQNYREDNFKTKAAGWGGGVGGYFPEQVRLGWKEERIGVWHCGWTRLS